MRPDLVRTLEKYYDLDKQYPLAYSMRGSLDDSEALVSIGYCTAAFEDTEDYSFRITRKGKEFVTAIGERS